jgi:HK97 family phage major capsid protein
MKNVLAKPIEVRSMPTLLEKRNTIVEAMQALVDGANTETRSMNEDEVKKFNDYKEEIGSIDSTLEAEAEAKRLQQAQANKVQNPAQNPAQPTEEQRAMIEAEDKFLAYIRGEERALDVAGNSGSIIPTLIADRIILRIKQLCPIYAMSTIYNIGGDLLIPKFDPMSITTAYVADLTALTAQNGNFTNVKLQNFIAGSLVVISRSLMNRSDFDLTTFIVNAMSQSIANFLENALLNGAGTTEATGIFVDASVTSVTAGSATALSTNDLIALQMAVPQAYQANCAWIFHPTVLTGLFQLKDTTGAYMLNRDITGEFQFTLLGRPVYISENAPHTMTTGLKIASYGDYSGLHVKLAQQVEIQILNEYYATQHGIGVVGYVEFDSKVVENQKIAVLKMA